MHVENDDDDDDDVGSDDKNRMLTQWIVVAFCATTTPHQICAKKRECRQIWSNGKMKRQKGIFGEDVNGASTNETSHIHSHTQTHITIHYTMCTDKLALPTPGYIHMCIDIMCTVCDLIYVNAISSVAFWIVFQCLGKSIHICFEIKRFVIIFFWEGRGGAEFERMHNCEMVCYKL